MCCAAMGKNTEVRVGEYGVIEICLECEGVVVRSG